MRSPIQILGAWLLFVCTCVLVLATQPARADWIEYYSPDYTRTDWQNALKGGYVVEDVNTVGSTIVLSTTEPYTIGTLTYLAVNAGPQFVVAGNVNGTPCLMWSGTTGSIRYTKVTLPGAYNGVAVDYYASAQSEDSDLRPHNSFYMRVSGNSGTWTSTYLPANGYLVNDKDKGRPASGFYGVIDTLGGITQFQVGTTWTNFQSFGADNFSYGILSAAKLAAIPNGGTLLDFGDVAPGTIGYKWSAVTLTNIGDPGTTIQLSGATFTDPRFSISSGDENASLDQNVSETFTLQFNAVGAPPGVYTASVTFNNDSPEGNVTYDLRANVVPIPEPAALGLVGAALLLVRRRRG